MWPLAQEYGLALEDMTEDEPPSTYIVNLNTPLLDI